MHEHRENECNATSGIVFCSPLFGQCFKAWCHAEAICLRLSKARGGTGASRLSQEQGEESRNQERALRNAVGNTTDAKKELIYWAGKRVVYDR